MVRPVDNSTLPLQSVDINAFNSVLGNTRHAVHQGPRGGPDEPERNTDEYGIEAGVGENPELDAQRRERAEEPEQGLGEATQGWKQDGDFITPPDTGITYE